MSNTEFYVKAPARAVMYWKMAVLRAIIYMGVVGIGTFTALTGGVDTGDWVGMGWFEREKVYLSVIGSCLTTLVAFLDSTMGKLQSKNGNGNGQQETKQ